ncbi:hypothetical protein EMCRGX_G028957 [Ephydatia muelleri]
MASTKELIILACMLVSSVNGYRPVVVMHGILSSYDSMTNMVQFIQKAHPGTEVLNVDAYNDADSVSPMWDQVNGVQSKIQSFVEGAPDGVHMICYSQGGLICRGILESYPTNIHTFVSLSSPQAGQYGDTDYLKYLFPNYTKEHLYLVFYTDAGQDVSVGGYWNDPYHQELYSQYGKFLPFLNNGSNPAFKSNFLKVQRLVLIGGPDDGVITPWESSQFGFFDVNSENVSPMSSQTFYLQDSFGLHTLQNAGKITAYTVPGIQHTEWPNNQDVFSTYIEPWLD